MNVNQAFPSQYLKEADVGESEPVVTIERVELEEVGPPSPPPPRVAPVDVTADDIPF